MRLITGAYLMVSAGCLTLGLIYLRFWLTDRTRRDYLAFLFLCLSVMLFAWCELGMMHSSSPEEFIFWIRSSHVPSAAAIISIAWFAHLALAGRRWLFITICAVRLLTLTLNYVFPNGINIREIKSIEHTQIFGETLTYAVAVPNPWTLIATSTFVLLIVYSVDASLRAWHRDDWRSAIVVSSGVVFFGLVALISPLLVIFGIFKVTFFSTPAVLLLIGIMLSRLNNDLQQSAMLSGQLRVKENELSEMLEMFNLSAEAANVGMWTRKKGEDFIWMSSKMCELFEFGDTEKPTLDQFIQKIHPEDREMVRETLKLTEPLHQEFKIEYRILLKDGHVRWIDGRGKVEFDGDEPKLIRGAAIVITERKLAEESFREQEGLLRQLIRNLPNGAVNVFDRNYRYLLGEGSELTKMGLSSELVCGKTITELFPRESFEYCLPYYKRAFAGQTVFFELPIFGEVYKLCTVPLHNRNDYIYAILVLIQNVTDYKQKEEQLRNLSVQLLTLQDEERKRLARELHDDLSQRVALLSIEIHELRDNIQSDSLREKFDSLSAEIQHFGADIHRISHNIHPAKLNQLGLIPALRSYCREMSAHYPINIEFADNKVLPQVLEEDISLCLYRVTQEAVQNAIKHSGADSVEVSINIEGDDLRLSISDNGRGFDSDAVKSKDSLGLISIKERIRAVDGRVTIKSKIGTGTKIEAQVAVTHFPIGL